MKVWLVLFSSKRFFWSGFRALGGLWIDDSKLVVSG